MRNDTNSAWTEEEIALWHSHLCSTRSAKWMTDFIVDMFTPKDTTRKMVEGDLYMSESKTIFSASNRAAGIISLFWSKLGHGMGNDDTLALQDIIALALENAYDKGCAGTLINDVEAICPRKRQDRD